MTYEDGSQALIKAAHYEYDALGRRVLKQVDNDGDSAVDLTEYYIYDGADLLLVLDDAADVTQRYLHGVRTNEVVAEETVDATSVTRWGLADHERSVRDVVIVDTGVPAVVDHIIYTAFGKVVSQTDSTNAIRQGYTGQVFDIETGLNYYNARYYDPSVGRFLNQDPTGFAAGDTNLYRYVSNDPLNYTDPSGLEAEGCTINGRSAAHGGLYTAAGLRKLGVDEATILKMLTYQASAQAANLQVDQIKRSMAYNFEGSSDIILNTYSFGAADAIGLTESTQYEGAGFDAARVSASISREAALGAVTGGSSTLATGTGTVARAAMAVNTGMRMMNPGRSGLAIGNGINRVASGDSGGWLDIGVGALSAGTNVAGGTRLGGTLNTMGRTTQAGLSGYQIGTGISKVRSGDASGYADIATGSFGAVTSVVEYADRAKSGVVYKRTNPKTGESYVGKSGSPTRFAARQGEHDQALGVQHEYIVLGRAKPGIDLDVLEESMIRAGGGLQKEGGTLVNARHQMSELRYRAAGGTVDDPNR